MGKHLLSGNEAIARGAYEAGVRVCSAYPGTPSTEIFENLPQYKNELYCEWAPNEKVAVEVAYGAAIGGARSLCAMKHVGLNVAADPLFTAAYNGVNRGFVIVTADDPSMHSSQNEQDNRYYARSAKVALVEPSDSQECIDFMKEAYRISEKFDMPVLFRTTTNISHSKSLCTFSERQEAEPFVYERNQRKYNCAPANAYRNHPKVEANLKALAEYGETCPLNKVEYRGGKVGVITASIAYEIAKDVFPEDTSFLKLGLTYPLPMGLIREFASKVETLYVIEELEGFMEDQIRAAGIPCIGKEKVSNLYELNPERLREMLFGVKPEIKELPVKAVPRPPVLCPGCPHRRYRLLYARRRRAFGRDGHLRVHGRRLLRRDGHVQGLCCDGPAEKGLRRRGRLDLLPLRHDRRGRDFVQQGRGHPRRARQPHHRHDRPPGQPRLRLYAAGRDRGRDQDRGRAARLRL